MVHGHLGDDFLVGRHGECESINDLRVISVDYLDGATGGDFRGRPMVGRNRLLGEYLRGFATAYWA